MILPSTAYITWYRFSSWQKSHFSSDHFTQSPPKWIISNTTEILYRQTRRQKQKHSTVSFTGINNVNPSINYEALSEVSEGYDAKYSNDERREAWHNDYEDPEYIETVRDHDYYITKNN